jgi:hypothetical protein
VFNGGQLAGTAGSVHTVIASATAQFGGLTATATSPSHVTGTATGTFGALVATARGSGPAVLEQGSWYGLLDILRDGAQLYREDREREPVACPNDGEPLDTGPDGQQFCPFDGWRPGGRYVGC